MYKKNENHYLIHSLFFLALSGPISMCKSANRFSSAVDRTMHLTQPNFNNFFQMCVTSKLRWDVVFKWCAHTLKLLGARNWKRKKAGYLRIANATCELFFFKKDFPLCYHHTQSLFSLCEMKQVLFLLNNITKKKEKKKYTPAKKNMSCTTLHNFFFFVLCAPINWLETRVCVPSRDFLKQNINFYFNRGFKRILWIRTLSKNECKSQFTMLVKFLENLKPVIICSFNFRRERGFRLL